MSVQAKAHGTARGGRAGQGWCMPRLVQDFGLELLAQQLWCWGRDIEHPGGNVLMQFGFERHRYQGRSERSSCYRLDDGDLHVCMWGFGIFFGQRDCGGLYLGRLDFCPRWAPIESLSVAIHQTEDLPAFARPRGMAQWKSARTLWKAMQKWIADYERWVCHTAGIAYRRECVDAWLRPFVSAKHMAPAWRFLSQRRWERQDQPLMQSLRKYIIPAVFE